MASKAFAAALAATKESKNLDTILVGSGYLGEGTDDVTVQAVDISKLESNILRLTYVNADGKTHNDNVFLMNRDGNDFGFGLRALWSALLPDTDALGKLIDAISADDAGFELITGMKLRITLRYGKGFRVHATDMGKFVAKDQETGEVLGEEFDSIDEARDDAKARAIKQSYLNVYRYEATDVAGNVAALSAAIENVAKAKAAGAGVIGSAFSAGTGLAKAI